MTLLTAQVRDVSTCVEARVVEGGWEPLRKHMCGSAGCGGGGGVETNEQKSFQRYFYNRYKTA
jgi:hypothetical protein